MAFYEVRQYKIRDGKMDEWVWLMEEEIIPYQISKGMVISASFKSENDDKLSELRVSSGAQPTLNPVSQAAPASSLYIFLRRFESDEQREMLYKAAYATEYWRERIRPIMADIIVGEMVITRVVPTPRSPMQ